MDPARKRYAQFQQALEIAPMKINPRGQITIPRHIREKLGSHPGIEVELTATDDAVVLRRRRDASAFVVEMRGRAAGGLSTDEIMALTRGDE